MKKILLSFLALVAMVGMVNAQRAWAYDLQLTSAESFYTFAFKATTAGTATLVFTDAVGAEVGTVDLGAVEAGANTKTLALAEVPGTGNLNWAVKMTGAAIEEVTEVTAAEDKYYYYLAQDVAANTNPESKYFGKMYVLETYEGAGDGASAHSKTQTSGIYVYDPVLNLENYAEGYLPSNVTTDPVATAYKHLHRMAINPTKDELAFVQSKAVKVWLANLNDLKAEATNVAAETGIKASSLCYDENGVLYVMDPFATTATIYKQVDGEFVKFVERDNWGWTDDRNAMESDGRGGLWVVQNISNLATNSHSEDMLTHINAAGEVDFYVNKTSSAELQALMPAASNRGQIGYDAKHDILALGGKGMVKLFNVTYTEDGPTLSLWQTVTLDGSNVDGLAFDYAGDLIAMSASVERFYKFALPTAENTCTTPAPKAQVVVKELPVTTYTIYVTAENGTVEGAGDYKEGTEVTLTATAAEGYEFVNWTVGDEEVSTENPYTFVVNADLALVANFQEVVLEPEYDMEITCTNLKTVSEGNMTYFMGSDVTGMEINLTILNFEGKGTYEVEGDLNAGGELYTLTGTATYDYSEELEADVLVAEVTANGEMSLLITMYKKVLVPTETITIENMTKTIQRLGWAQTLRLDGEHETYGQVTIAVTGCDGKYGTYNTTVYLNAIELSLTGEGEWKNDGEVDVLEVIGELEDGSKVVKVIGKTPAEEAKEPIELYADVTFTVDESGDLNLVGEANTGEVINIWVASWADNGYGEYAAGEVWGTIDGVDVSNMSEAVTIEQDGLVAYVYALLEGTDGNIYKLTAGGMGLADPSQGGEGEEDDTKLTVNDADIAPGVVNTSDLELYGSTSDWKEINVVLKNGTTKLYGDYTAEELEIMVNWEEATLATGTVASYYELEGVAVFEATVLLGEKTYELTISGTPWVDPSTIVPTETIELEFANAEIKYQYGGLNITAANGDASLVLKINTTADAMYGSFTFDDLFQFVSSVVVGDDEISFIYGTVVVEKVKEGEYTYDKVTTSLLGANHKLYNMVATTTPKSTPTGLDNVDTTVAPAKVINNGQLIIIRNGVQYNAQGAVVK